MRDGEVVGRAEWLEGQRAIGLTGLSKSIANCTTVRKRRFRLKWKVAEDIYGCFSYKINKSSI
jgi:hypothetical protein